MIQNSKSNLFSIQTHIHMIEDSRFKRVCLEFPLYDKILLQTRKKMIEIGDRFLQFYFLHYFTIHYEYLSVSQLKKLQIKFVQYLHKMAQVYGLVNYLKNSNKFFFTQNQLSSQNIRDYFRLYIGCWYTLRKEAIREYQRCHYSIDNQLAPLLIAFAQRNNDILKQQNIIIGEQFQANLYPIQLEEAKQEAQKNYKNLLQQSLQKKKQNLPKYTEGKIVNNGKVTIVECQATFTWEGEKLVFKGIGSTRKQASFDAAKKGYIWVQGVMSNTTIKNSLANKLKI